MRAFLCCLLLLLSLTACSRSRQQDPQPDGALLAATVTRLASPELAGRRAGTPGGAAARTYLLERLATLDLEPLPALADFEQSFAIEGEELADLQAHLISPSGSRYLLWLSARAPLRPGRAGPLLLWTDAEELPPLAGDEILLRHGPSRRGETFSPSELQRAADLAGAAALVLLPHPEDADGLYARYLQRVKSRDRRLYALAGAARELPLAYLDTASASPLLEEGQLALPSWRLALPDAQALALTGRNLIARLPASGANSGGVLLLAAHYDHLGVGETGYFPGADDNASSVAVLLELARLLDGKRFPFELRLLFADAEELGLLGAEAYLRSLDPPALMINLDSVGRASVDSYRKLRQPGAASDSLLILWRSPAAELPAQALRRQAERSGFAAQWGEGPMFAYGGDHHAFARVGVPSIFLFGGFHADYNTPEDRADRISIPRLARLTSALLDYLTELESTGLSAP